MRVRRLATFWGGAASSLRKDGPDRGEPIEWIRPPVGHSDGGGHRLRESGMTLPSSGRSIGRP